MPAYQMSSAPLDPIADLVIREPIGVTMRTVLQRLDPNGTSN